MKQKVNNDYYNHLGETWYVGDDNPIAILRIEQNAKNPWVKEKISNHFNTNTLHIADIGCGGGFLANYLSLSFSDISGLDASESSLVVAKKNDSTSKVNYILGDAYKLPFADASLDVVCAMDFLEHVENPELVIKECSRVLKKDGMFLFNTFNRNILSWLVVIKFIEWFVPNTPKNLHVLNLFIKPSELEEMMIKHRLKSKQWTGLGPKFDIYFFKSLFARKVKDGFSFKTNNSLLIGYMGYSIKI